MFTGIEVESFPDWKEQKWRESRCVHVVQMVIQRIYDVLVTIVDGNCICVNARCCVLCGGLDKVTLERVVEVRTYPFRNTQCGGKPCRRCARGELFSSVYDVYDLKEKGVSV